YAWQEHFPPDETWSLLQASFVGQGPYVLKVKKIVDEDFKERSLFCFLLCNMLGKLETQLLLENRNPDASEHDVQNENLVFRSSQIRKRG
ncbi:hypothetical protein AVEN_110105-1, partial [Araneus ventricosus]